MEKSKTTLEGLKIFYACNKYPMELTKDVIPFVFSGGKFLPLSESDLDKDISDYKFIVRSDLYLNL